MAKRRLWPASGPRGAAVASPPFSLNSLVSSNRDENEARIRGTAFAVNLPDDVILCRVLGRYKMHADARDHGLSPHLVLDGYWEMWLTEAIPNFLRKGMVAWDVGANLGYFTILCADIVGAGGKVHACEPNERMSGLLMRSAMLNGFGGRVILHKAPLSDQAGQPVALAFAGHMPQNATVEPREESPAALHTTTLDDLIGDGPVDFIKIDADGAERAIWRGMPNLLRRRDPLTIFLEFTPDRYEDAAGFLAEMLDASFRLGIVDPWAGIIPVSPQGVLNHAPANIDRMLILSR